MSVGDKIVADRFSRLGDSHCTDREAADILAKAAPRSAQPGSWPPSKAEVKRLREQAKAK